MWTGRGAMFSYEHPSIVQHHAEKSAVDLQAAVVLDEAELSELVHEKVHTRTGRAHHLGERFLRQLWQHPLPRGLFAVPGEQQERSRQSFLTRVEELIDQILLDP